MGKNKKDVKIAEKYNELNAETKLIVLSRGLFAKVGSEDFKDVERYTWFAQPNGTMFYAKNSKTGMLMHRYILGMTDYEKTIDHKDRDGLNNTRDNLRICTFKQNSYNISCRATSMSKYKGVTHVWQTGKWRVRITTPTGRISLGIYNTEEEAAKVYDCAAIKYQGEFANLNFKNGTKQ